MKLCVLLISNPANPVGNIFSRETLFSVLEFAQEKKIQVICGEILAGSVHRGKDLTSIAEVIETESFDKNRAHNVYGLSKDLSIPGFKVGVIYSYTEGVLEAAKKLTRFCFVSGPLQRLMISVLSGTRFIDEYLEITKKRLRSM